MATLASARAKQSVPSWLDSSPDWVRLTALYWQWPMVRSQSELDMALREFERTFRANPIDDVELCNAVRWLSGPENRQDKCPTLRELIRAVCILRKQDRVDFDHGAKIESCRLCLDGWVTDHIGYDQAWTLKDFMMAETVCIPCTCRAGDRLMSMCDDYAEMSTEESDLFNERRRAACKQAEIYQALIADAEPVPVEGRYAHQI
jgi:hypothetical protein